MMKKTICMLMCFCMWVNLCGFSNYDIGTIVGKDGKVIEFVQLGFNDQDLFTLHIETERFGDTLTKFKKHICKDLKSLLKLNGVKVTAENNYNTIQVQISYDDKDYYNYLCDINNDDIINTSVNNVLTTDNIIIKKIYFSKINVGIETYRTCDYIYESLYQTLVMEYGLICANALKAPNLVYSYVTPYHRLHSNAEEIICDGNYYYHNYLVTDINNQQIKLWFTTANKIVWYCGATCLALIFMVVYSISIRIKDSKKNKNMNKVL